MAKVEGRNVQNSWEMHSAPYTRIQTHAYLVKAASVPRRVGVPGRGGILYLWLDVCSKTSIPGSSWGLPFYCLLGSPVESWLDSQGIARLNVFWGSHTCIPLPGSASWFWLEVSPGACRPLFCCLLTLLCPSQIPLIASHRLWGAIKFISVYIATSAWS